MKNLKIITGQHRPEDFSKTDTVVKNPAIPWTNKYIKIARENNIPVETDASLFFKYCPSKKIIGITGTKGKTTTSLLVYKILKSAGKKVVKVGISQEPVMSKLAEINEDTFVVFELSSWRLSGLANTEKRLLVSVITNIFPDHLNYYGSMEEYIKDKKIILDIQSEEDFCVINQDNEESKKLAREARAKVIFFSLEEIGCDECVFIKEGGIVFKKDGLETKILNLSDLKLRGHHNIYNALAAIGATVSLGVKNEYIKGALIEYEGTPHRLEFVREIRGVKFYNDTTATVPKAAIAGINSFLKPTHLICGGSSKNIDLSEFARKISTSKYVRNIYLLDGNATEKLLALIKKEGGKEKLKGLYKNIELAIGEAFREAKDGEIVLLSPACASFGMFKNEFDRGNKFKEVVNNL